jgi:UDP-N-acetylglucosamine--N-acetylmuramyl-(pentapeptide) pyrophosphoryl-undecaprenol N-acetylglucosamine transferase
MVTHRIVLTGGGTGGHIYPALAVAEQLKDSPDVEGILYIGARGHKEEKLALERGLKFIGLDVSGMPRKLSPRLLTWPFQIAGAVLECRRYLRNFKPTVVLGTGGYASAPPLWAAQWLGVPYAIHEPDAHPGWANGHFAGNATLVSCGMEGAVDRLKSKRGRVVVNGNPVGNSFVNLLRRDSACAVLGLNTDMKTLLITGGSQGARALNEAVLDALPTLLEMDPPIQVIHQVGEKNFVEFKERLTPSIQNSNRYFLRDYFDDLALAYAVTDLAICRSGAMTIAEMAVTGCPAIFVPYPFAAQDHQMHNARFMETKGAAIVIPQEKLTGDLLKQEVLRLLGDDERLRAMSKAMHACGKPQAAADLASQLKEVSTAFQMKHSKQQAVLGP